MEARERLIKELEQSARRAQQVNIPRAIVLHASSVFFVRYPDPCMRLSSVTAWRLQLSQNPACLLPLGPSVTPRFFGSNQWSDARLWYWST